MATTKIWKVESRIDNAIKGIEPNECNIIQFEKIV